MNNNELIRKIIDEARWAPSGDNGQPWRFYIPADQEMALEVHGQDTRREVVYDFRGRASRIAHGALLETIRIVASQYGLRSDYTVREGCSEERPVYDVLFTRVDGLSADPLLRFVKSRVVQRRPMKLSALTEQEMESLVEAVGPGYRLEFFKETGDRFKMAKLLWKNAHIRLTCPEAYPVHKKVIEWNAQFSKDRIPDQAVGIDPVARLLMKWALKSWSRVNFMNKFMGGTLIPRVELDFLPAIFCSSHILMRAENPPVTLNDYVSAGHAWQRLWLTVSSLGMYLQPEMTPVIFRWYRNEGEELSREGAVNREVANVAEDLDRLARTSIEDRDFVFLCRIGRSAKPAARSTRMELEELMLDR